MQSPAQNRDSAASGTGSRLAKVMRSAASPFLRPWNRLRIVSRASWCANYPVLTVALRLTSLPQPALRAGKLVLKTKHLRAFCRFGAAAVLFVLQFCAEKNIAALWCNASPWCSPEKFVSWLCAALCAIAMACAQRSRRREKVSAPGVPVSGRFCIERHSQTLAFYGLLAFYWRSMCKFYIYKDFK